MGAADFNRPVSFIAATVAENDAGEKVATGWAEFATAWASFKPVSDGERWRAGANEQKADARFVIRWSDRLAGITGEHRLIMGGETWQIAGAKEIGWRDRLELTAWRLVV